MICKSLQSVCIYILHSIVAFSEMGLCAYINGVHIALQALLQN